MEETAGRHESMIQIFKTSQIYIDIIEIDVIKLLCAKEIANFKYCWLHMICSYLVQQPQNLMNISVSKFSGTTTVPLLFD